MMRVLVSVQPVTCFRTIYPESGHTCLRGAQSYRRSLCPDAACEGCRYRMRIRDDSLHPATQGAMDHIPGHELHGARQVGQWPADELVDLWGRASSGVVKHAFVIEYRDLEPPKTGIFDGLRIVIDPDVAFEMQCFLLLHLFGHSVQWVAPSL